ncbi:MAG TPA: hypothetical protein EYM34_04575 [Alphaproteobacteria bacterium]|nr:hypothetical protein [Alphaproteobacteria bacterium]
MHAIGNQLGIAIKLEAKDGYFIATCRSTALPAIICWVEVVDVRLTLTTTSTANGSVISLRLL